MNADDRAAVRAQLGREPRGEVSVAWRCPCGLPGVIETGPSVDDAPFPTMFWLSCARACSQVGRLEAAGCMRELNQRLADDAAFASAFAGAQHEHIAARGVAVGGGPADRVKCLHAHLAHFLAT